MLLGVVLGDGLNAIRDAQKAVFNLWMNDMGQMRIICTGTAVNTPEGIVFLSAGHCVADNPRAGFWVSQNTNPDIMVRVNLKWWEFQGIDRWKEGDYAVFEFPGGYKPAATVAVCTNTPKPGDAVYTWTGPLGMLPILRVGTYSGEIHFPDSPEDEEAIGGMLFAEISGAGGSSGSSMLMVENGKACTWGIWVGAFNPRPDGAIVSRLPGRLRY